jgi:hypothetical protein
VPGENSGKETLNAAEFPNYFAILNYYCLNGFTRRSLKTCQLCYGSRGRLLKMASNHFDLL